MIAGDFLKGKILIIDDAKNIRLLTAKALTSDDYTVDCASNGYDGMELFSKGNYDLVLLDIRMPNFSGTDVLKHIKDMNPTVPVVIITAYPTVKNAVDCLKLGAVDYLRKPFTSEKIKEFISQILLRKSLTSTSISSYDSSIEYAKKCINEKNFDEALEFLKKAISIDISRSEPFNIMGNIFELKGDMEAAYKYYNIALLLEPNNEEVIENLNRINSEEP